MRQGEIAALDGIAGELGITRNQVMRYAIRQFLLDYMAGKLDLTGSLEEPPPPKKILRLPE